jgi:hypothetical protein
MKEEYSDLCKPVIGTKLKVVHRWNPAYFNAPVVAFAINAQGKSRPSSLAARNWI